MRYTRIEFHSNNVYASRALVEIKGTASIPEPQARARIKFELNIKCVKLTHSREKSIITQCVCARIYNNTSADGSSPHFRAHT